MSIIHRVDQGTIEWHQLRMGKPTSSNFHRLIMPKTRKPSAQADAYMYRLICERLINEVMDDPLDGLRYIEAGKMYEPQAAAQFSFITGLELEPVGFVTTDNGTLGCSPDRLVIGCKEAVEIKCPAPWTHMGHLLDGPGDNYQPQVQGQLLVGGFDTVHFYSWNPQMPPVHRNYTRDDNFIATLADILGHFCDKLNRETERARSMGTFVARTYYQNAATQAAAKQVDPEYLQ